MHSKSTTDPTKPNQNINNHHHHQPLQTCCLVEPFDFPPDIEDRFSAEGNDDHVDHQYEEEEAFYIFEFGKHLTKQELEDANYQCKLVGFNSDHPFMQIGSSIFSGTNHQALGNDLVFTKSSLASEPVMYAQTLDRRVQMVPIRLQHRTPQSIPGPTKPTAT